MTTRGIYFEKSSQPPRTPQPIRVLIVDDELDSVLTLSTLLKDEGFQAHGVHSGKQALDMLRSFDPDAVLIDIAMPDISGWELARRIRSETGDARPLIIGLTGKYKQTSDKILAEMSGFNHYLLKPYDFPWLRRLLVRLRAPR